MLRLSKLVFKKEYRMNLLQHKTAIEQKKGEHNDI